MSLLFSARRTRGNPGLSASLLNPRRHIARVFVNSLQTAPAWRISARMVMALVAVLWVSVGSDPAVAQAITRVAVINTIAGDGTAGYGGDSGPATSAELNNPYGLAIDTAGNLYIADPANNRVRKVALATGIITTIAGNGTAGYGGDNGPAASAELNLPAAVAVVDSSGDLYIADEGNSVIRKVNSSGIITTVAGNNAVGYSGDGGAATNATL
jgi:hypothetical protein